MKNPSLRTFIEINDRKMLPRSKRNIADSKPINRNSRIRGRVFAKNQDSKPTVSDDVRICDTALLGDNLQLDDVGLPIIGEMMPVEGFFGVVAVQVDYEVCLFHFGCAADGQIAEFNSYDNRRRFNVICLLKSIGNGIGEMTILGEPDVMYIDTTIM